MKGRGGQPRSAGAQRGRRLARGRGAGRASSRLCSRTSPAILLSCLGLTGEGKLLVPLCRRARRLCLKTVAMAPE